MVQSLQLLISMRKTLSPRYPALNLFIVSFLFLGLLLNPFFVHANPDHFTDELITEQIDVIQLENATPYELILKTKKTEYLISPPSHEELAEFNQLSLETRTKFLDNRKLFLNLVSKSLNSLKWGFGIGSIIKDQIIFVKEKIFKKENAEQNMTDTAINTMSAKKQKFSERSNQIVLNFLKAADKLAWNKIQLFSEANEVGVLISGNAILLGEVNGRFKAGGLFGLGLSIGVNFEKKSAVFQIFRDVEKYEKSVMNSLGVVGLVGKAGLYIVSDKQKLYQTKGSSFYPPVIPGFQSESSTKYITGASTGLTFPPAPIADILTYTNRLNENTMLKIETTTTFNKFIRVQAENPGVPLKTLAISISDSIQKMSDYTNAHIHSKSLGQCKMLFQ